MFGYLVLSSAAAFASADFWSPLNPPRATYVLEARVSSDGSRLDGSEAVRFTNNTPRPIGRVAFLFEGSDLRLRANGAAAERITGVKHPALFELPRDIAPGESVELVADWVITHEPIKDGEGIATSSWYPRLWWGFETLADYQVKLEAPAGLTVLAGGKSQNGVILAPGTRALGIFAGKGFQTASADAGSVPVTIVFTPKGSECAHLLLKTAVDAIGYYQGRFGYYPQNSLTIVPGGDYPAGGYPVATAMVVVHGQERMKEKPDDWWRWITAHEIGHMYWSEHVLAQSPIRSTGS
jgi:hypothetical protein